MLTPVDVQNKVFKGGIGFDKKDVEAFMSDLASDYSELYRSNVELKDKVATLDESLQHYRTIEESVQKSLTISEKAAEETMNAAKDKARQINIEAEKKAESIVADAQAELERLQEEIFRLQNQHKQFVSQFKKVLNAQLQLCDGKVVDIDLGEGFDSSRYADEGYSSFGSEGGLGGGGYTGSNSYEDRERAAGEPASNIGSLNIDPFADPSKNGRFSSKTSQKTSSSSGDSSKLSLNMKAGEPKNVKIKRNVSNATSDYTGHEPAEPVKKKNTTNEAPQKKINSSAGNQTNNADLEAKKAAEAAERLAAEKALKEAAARQEAERKAAQEAARKAKEQAEEKAKNEKIAREHLDKELESTINAVKEAAKKQEAKSEKEDPYANQSINYHAIQQAKEKAAAKEAAKKNKTTADLNTSADDTAFSGEVESKIDESTMLDSEDNYSTGFDFISDDDTASDMGSVSSSFDEDDDSAFVGEVEDKVNEATMLDSEDNYSDGFDFLVEEEPSEEIPVINQGLNADFGFSIHSTNDNNNESAQTEAAAGLNLDLNFSGAADSDDDVFVGDVEDNVKQSNLIGNDDDEDEGFNFL